jgi:integrase
MAETHDHKHVDFHSLRYTCGAWLAMDGVPVKTVQTIMRHSTITLTMDTYGNIFPGQEADAIARFPDMMRRDEPATGTLGRIAPEIVHEIVHKPADNGGQRRTTGPA